jgi:TM2 domain-containing membrane protein YozV
VVVEKNLFLSYLMAGLFLFIPASILVFCFCLDDGHHVEVFLVAFYLVVGLVLFLGYISSTYPVQGGGGGYFWSGYWISLFPLTPLELMDTKNRSISTTLSLPDARILCDSALRMFPSCQPLPCNYPDSTVAARIDMVVTILNHVARKDTGHSEIVIDGWITDHPDLQYGEDLRMREQATRQVIRVLDSIQSVINGRIAATEAGTGPVSLMNTKDIRLVAALSLLIPGLGQHYCGRMYRGLTFLALTGVGIIFFLVPGILVWLYGVVDAVRLARQVNAGTEPFVHVLFIVLAMEAVVSIPVLVLSVVGCWLLVSIVW